MQYIPFHFEDFEAQPARWAKLFEKTWHAYERWFLKEGQSARPGYLSSSSAFEQHFPELYPTYLKRCEASGGSDLRSRFLSMYCPPPYMSGCSQLAWTQGDCFLIRNYDYSPRYFEGVFVKTHWHKEVMGMSDCTWGLLDGINEDGLSASLTFGGRRLIAPGFGIPIVVRYCLETCANVQEAIAKLQPIPVHMAYNVTLLDATGDFATIYFVPGGPNQVVFTPIGTNQQREITWEDYAVMTQTQVRKDLLHELTLQPALSRSEIQYQFMQAPLYNTAFEKAFGTLYTATYDPAERSVLLQWPGKQHQLHLKDYLSGKLQVKLSTSVNRLLTI